MELPPPGAVAVIFLSARNGADAEGYAAAAEAMEAASRLRPGFLGFRSVREAGGLGITISLWADGAAARAWRDDPDHARIREAGRSRWYDWYQVIVAEVERAYAWTRRGEAEAPGVTALPPAHRPLP